MSTDRDLFYRCAQMLLDKHGQKAELLAAEEADGMLARGDADGVAVWKRIIAAIAELRRTVPAPGEKAH